jgi:putative membrane protein
MSASTSSLVSVGTVDPTAVSDQDRTFLQQAQIANIEEVGEGKLAQTHNASLSSREFGRWMIGDHGSLAAGLTVVAGELGVTLPTSLDAQHQAELQDLAGRSGTDFDQAYASGGVQDHAASIALFQQEASSGSNPTLVSIAQQTLPLLQAHFQQAQILAGSLGGSAGTNASADDGSGAAAAGNQPAVEDPITQTSAGPLNSQDSAFLQQAGTSNLAEIAEGQVAASRMGDVPTSEFGNWMVSDHTALNATLAMIAQQQGTGVPTAPTTDQQTELSKLQAAPDDTFASVYASAQVLDHAQTLMQFITEATTGQNAALTSFARNTVPILAQHLAGAVDLELSAAGINPPEQMIASLGDLLGGAGSSAISDMVGTAPSSKTEQIGRDGGSSACAGGWHSHTDVGAIIPVTQIS